MKRVVDVWGEYTPIYWQWYMGKWLLHRSKAYPQTTTRQLKFGW